MKNRIINPNTIVLLSIIKKELIRDIGKKTLKKKVEKLEEKITHKST